MKKGEAYLPLMKFKDTDLITMGEIATRFGVTRDAVKRWRTRPWVEFPPPDLKPPGRNSTPLWYWKTIRKWALIKRPKML